MSKLILAVAVLFITTSSHAGEAPPNVDQKVLYSIGLTVARTLSVFNLSAQELTHVLEGITDGVSGKKPAVDLSAYNPKIQELARTRRSLQGQRNSAEGKAFSDKAAKDAGAITTSSGLVFLSLVEGKGNAPQALDTVRVNYRGTLIDGKEFDSSFKRGKPLEFKLDRVIKCWNEGIQLMKPGGKARLVCPASIAYGDNGAGETIPPGATLNFEVELLDIVKPATGDTPAQPSGGGKSP